MSYNYLPLDKKWLHFQQIKNLLTFNQLVSITFDAHAGILKCREYLDKKLLNKNELFYGVNTGFGYLQNVRIDNSQIEQLQHNLLTSHACGLGNHVPIPVVKLMLMLKIKSLSYGNSGIHIETVKRMMELYNNDIIPVVYTQGSLGASGDLAPLSHLSLPLIGLGDVWYHGEIKLTSDVYAQLGWQPIQLHSKEGLALINGTQFMTAYGLYCLQKAEQLIKMAHAVAAISYNAFDCNIEPLHEKIQSLRSHNGQVQSAATMRKYLHGSSIGVWQKTEIQDPYSFRCIPQVHGATTDAFDHVLQIFIREANSVTDNPNIFPDDDLILNGGNFHGQPLAMALDYFAIAMSGLANISERRTYQLISGQRNLPLFLAKDAGLHSGYMIPQYTAASIVSENKQLCTPASVDSISSSNNQEDYVSMGANAATKCLRVVDNVAKVLGIEMMAAVQALEFRRPLHTSPVLEQIVADFRKIVPANNADHVLHYDMVNATGFITNYPLPL